MALGGGDGRSPSVVGIKKKPLFQLEQKNIPLTFLFLLLL